MDAAAFQRDAGNYGVDWTVLFVEAPIDKVSDTYARFRKCEIDRNVPLDVAPTGEAPPRGAIVQPANSAWVILFHEWSSFAEFPLLSGINSRVVEFGGSDGTRAHTCNLFTPSKPLVRYKIQSVAEEDDEYYEASGRSKASRPKFTPVGSYGQVFEQLDIKPLFIYLNEQRHVVIREEQRPEIVRIDVAVL